MDRKIEPKTWFLNRQRLFVLAALGVIVISCLALVMSSSSAYRVDSERLTVAEVKRAPFQDYISVRARVEPSYMAYLDAVEGGIVEDILLEEGSLVKQGDTILVLSNLNLSLNILNSEAQLAEKANFLRETQINMEQQKLSLERDLLMLEYDLLQTERQYDRNKLFYKDEYISKDEFMASEESYQLASRLKELSEQRHRQDSIFRKNQIRKIKSNLKNMERNLELIYRRQDHLVVRAPVDGQLASLNAVPGQSIMPGYRMGQINVLGDYKLQASIDEHYIDRVHAGLTATMERQGQSFELRVSKVYPEVREGQFLVDLTFEGQQPANIRSGQGYGISISLGETHEAILLPKGAFFQTTGGQWVYALAKDGKSALKRPIRIGRHNPRHYEVLEGLEPGDQVVISSYELYDNNDKLKIRH